MFNNQGEATYRGHYIQIAPDTDYQESPTKWDNLAKIALTSGVTCNTPLGCTDGIFAELLEDTEFMLFNKTLQQYDDKHIDTEKGWRNLSKKYIILPIHLVSNNREVYKASAYRDHGSNHVGFIYASIADIRDEYDVGKLSPKLRNTIHEYMDSLLSVFTHYINGDIYGFSIYTEGQEENPIKTCTGFYGDDFSINGLEDCAKAFVDSILNEGEIHE